MNSKSSLVAHYISCIASSVGLMSLLLRVVPEQWQSLPTGIIGWQIFGTIFVLAGLNQLAVDHQLRCWSLRRKVVWATIFGVSMQWYLACWLVRQFGIQPLSVPFSLLCIGVCAVGIAALNQSDSVKPSQHG